MPSWVFAALGQKQTCAAHKPMSALPPIDAIMPEVLVPQGFPETGRARGKLWGKHSTGPSRCRGAHTAASDR